MLPEVVQNSASSDVRSASDLVANRVGALAVVRHVFAVITTEYTGDPLAELIGGPGISVEGITAALANASGRQVFTVLFEKHEVSKFVLKKHKYSNSLLIAFVLNVPLYLQ